MIHSNGSDVVVVGGGVIGLSVAWKLAGKGASVTVVDDHPGEAASWAAAGMLAPVTEVHYGEEPLLALARTSADLYPRFVDDLERASGLPAGYSDSGTLAVALDADENAVLQELYLFQSRLGLEAERMKSAACRALEPGLSSSVRGGIFVPGDHQIDNRLLLAALRTACERGGVRFVNDRVAELRGREAVEEAVTEDGNRIRCRTAVLAAGCWSSALTGVPEQALPPVRPVKGQILQVRPLHPVPPLDHSIRGADVYIVPRADGRVIVGATVEELGFDTRVTAGAVHELLRDARELVPSVDDMELIETSCGLRPGSPDNAPMIGPSVHKGLVIATGHYRNGILLAPVTADALSAFICDGELPESMAPFTPQRFSRRPR